MLLAVTLSPDWLNEAFHMPVTFWLPGKVQPALQPLRPEAPAVTVTWAWNPPDQPSTIAYLAVQPLPPPLEPMAQVKVADPDAPVPSRAVTVAVYVPAVVGVPEISPVEELTERPGGSPEAL